MMRLRAGRERGITLVEVTVVMVLASLVMVGLVGFYVTSQNQWLTASSQVVTQREGTMVLELMADSIRASATCVVEVTDSLRNRITLHNRDGIATNAFYWNSGDSLLHWERPAGTERGPITTARVSRFQAFENDTMVTISALHLIDPDGDLIQLTGGAAMYNRP